MTELFNLLTGYTRPQKFNHLLLAPVALREQFLARIRKEADHARTGQPASIIAKVNSLIDPAVIDELYMASQAGVQIELLVRGMCSLRPGLPGISERIRVLSIVDRYLEHARIFYFQNGGEPIFLLASADWMQRNFDQRVEIAFPILDPVLQKRLKDILDTQLCDNIKGWWMHPDGSYLRTPTDGGAPLRSQDRLYELAASAT